MCQTREVNGHRARIVLEFFVQAGPGSLSKTAQGAQIGFVVANMAKRIVVFADPFP
jgi:hypothetical protein